MILPDINLLVYAYNEDAPHHAKAKLWWEDCLSGSKPVALTWIVLLGFVRLMSNRRVLVRPMSAQEAIGHCRTWLQRPQTCIVQPGPEHTELLADLMVSRFSSNLVTDAHLAALAIEQKAELHSNDSDFAQFPGLVWRNPVA